jgi:hypothetical protein
MTPASAAALAKRLIPSAGRIEALLTHRTAQSAATVAALAAAWSLGKDLEPARALAARARASGVTWPIWALTARTPSGAPRRRANRVAVSNSP